MRLVNAVKPQKNKIVGHVRRILTNFDRHGILKIAMESTGNWVNVRCGRRFLGNTGKICARCCEKSAQKLRTFRTL